MHIWALKTQKLLGPLSGPWTPTTDSSLHLPNSTLLHQQLLASEARPSPWTNPGSAPGLIGPDSILSAKASKWTLGWQHGSPDELYLVNNVVGWNFTVLHVIPFSSVRIINWTKILVRWPLLHVICIWMFSINSARVLWDCIPRQFK